LTHSTGQSSAHNAFRLWLHSNIVNDRQRRWCSWRLAHPLLEEADVEDIMKLGAWRKSEEDGYFIDELGDAVGPKEARLQLPFGRLGQRRDRAMAKAEQDPVAHGVGDVTVLLVVVELLHSLGLLQPVPDIPQELLALGHGLGHNSHPRVPRLIRPDGRRVAAVDHPERHVVQ